MAPPPGSVFIVGVDVLGSACETKTKTILIQAGDVVASEVASVDAELWQTCGVASRPANATPGQAAAQAIMMRRSDRDVCLAIRDTRANAMYGTLAPGETCIYATTGQARALLKADGSISLVTTSDNASTGTSVILKISPTALEFAAPWGGIKFDSAGFKVWTQDGATTNSSINMTSAGVFQVLANTCAIQSGMCMLGTAATAASPARYGTTAVPLVSTSVFVSP